LRGIATALAKYQVTSVFKSLQAIHPMRTTLAWNRTKHTPRAETQARAIRKMIEDLGTTYVKLGQWLSVRPDVVPPELLKELEKLQDQLPPLTFKSVKRIIEQETREPLEKTFYSFDAFPLATASIGQVHRGVLKTGQEVAIKIQRPHLKRRFTVDLDVLRSVAAWAVKKWPHLALHNPEGVLAAFKTSLMDETNFIEEAKNQSRMKMLFKDAPWVRIAEVYWEYTTERLLVMEYLDGVKVTQPEFLSNSQLDRNLLARRMSESTFRQIFEFGFFQSDPHPGNLLFMKNNQLGIIDFGITGRLDSVLLHLILDWIYAGIYRDVDLLSKTLLEVGTALVPVDKIQLRNDCMSYLDEIHFQPAERISFMRMFTLCQRIQYRHKIVTPPVFMSIFKTIGTLEGYVRRIDPDFDWRHDWGPRLRKIMDDRYSPDAILTEFRDALQAYRGFIARFPEDMREMMDTIKEGKFDLRIQMPEVETHLSGIQSGLHKLAVSVAVSTVIFGLFYLGRGQNTEFLAWLLSVKRDIWWIVLLLILFVFYLRRR
jgi:ubiquinone biosynthesis protein